MNGKYEQYLENYFTNFVKHLSLRMYGLDINSYLLGIDTHWLLLFCVCVCGMRTDSRMDRFIEDMEIILRAFALGKRALVICFIHCFLNKLQFSSFLFFQIYNWKTAKFHLLYSLEIGISPFKRICLLSVGFSCLEICIFLFSFCNKRTYFSVVNAIFAG